MTFEFKSTPYSHQLERFLAHGLKAAWGVLWDQGTGKTKTLLDTAAQMFERGEINAILIVAPNGVHRNWINDEIPLHLVDRVARRALLGYYESKRARTKAHEYMIKGMMHHEFPIIAISYNAYITKRGRLFAANFLKQRKVLMILDEAHKIKSPSAKVAKAIVASGKYAAARRIATGTIIANGNPFDAYMPIRFLDPDFWKDHGLGTFAEYKNHFGIWKKSYDAMGNEFPFCVAYRRLHLLKSWMTEISDRVEKDDVLDLPPKLYSKRYFDMTPEQARVYKEIKNDALATIETDDGLGVITAILAITRLLRMQQVTCGYVPPDESGEDDEGTRVVELIGDKNPRLDLLVELCDSMAHPAIIWARFRKDIDLIMEKLGDRAVRYDGKVSDDDREIAKQKFQGGEVQFFVGNPAAGATGLTLTAARTVIYYSNSFKFVDRVQSEDRAHRIGQEHPVDYIDIVATGTVDISIVNALRDKMDIAREITGDKLKEWI